MTTQPSEAQASNTIWTESGSSWTGKHNSYYKIKRMDSDPLTHPALASNFGPTMLNEDIANEVSSLSSSFLWKRPFKTLMMPYGGLGTMFGLFLTIIAHIKEQISPSEPRANPPRAARKDYRETSGSEDENDPGDKSRKRRVSFGDRSYAEQSETTDQSTHLERAKKELPTQVMVYLYNTFVFEGSNLPSRLTSPEPGDTTSWCLEWNIEPHVFRVESPKVYSKAINDGALLHKGFDIHGHWVTKSDLVYCSVEVTIAKRIHISFVKHEGLLISALDKGLLCSME